MTSLRNYFLKAFVFFSLLIVFGSCVPQKDVVYIQDTDEVSELHSYHNPRSKNLIKAFDQLYIQVNSFDDGRINFMSNDANRYGGGRSEADLAMVAFTVSEDGHINMPIIGAFKVVGLSVEEAAEKIKLELEQYLNTPSVKVSLVNKNVTILGNVLHPGRYFYASEQLNIFQALGMAGDVTEYGNRRYVVLVREKNGEVFKKRIDLTDIALLGDEEFYLSHNDVVYVEPLKRRHWGMQTFPWALILSGITTFVLVANYINK
ncbi:polysaccharide biosynthesis/export family protein [Carboxylicivirga taeanensis]|uniref:polysaccharide biosynthesis/export family protein n=1 Tax=Carboxylicivirga taeanensis TaxID=1416875 RepID=UPI003F6E1436